MCECVQRVDELILQRSKNLKAPLDFQDGLSIFPSCGSSLFHLTIMEQKHSCLYAAVCGERHLSLADFFFSCFHVRKLEDVVYLFARPGQGT